MRQAGQIVAEVLEIMKELVKPGVTTSELDKAAESTFKKCRKQSQLLKGYNGFPASLCTSSMKKWFTGFPV
jgi:methionyl aminopeptidase